MQQCMRRGLSEARLLLPGSSSSSSRSLSSGEEKKKPKTGILMLNMGGPRDSSEVRKQTKKDQEQEQEQD